MFSFLTLLGHPSETSKWSGTEGYPLIHAGLRGFSRLFISLSSETETGSSQPGIPNPHARAL